MRNNRCIPPGQTAPAYSASVHPFIRSNPANSPRRDNPTRRRDSTRPNRPTINPTNASNTSTHPDNPTTRPSSPLTRPQPQDTPEVPLQY